MTEEEAHTWIAERCPPGGLTKLQEFVDLLLEANTRQNLISKTTEAVIWTRHILDSAQLIRFAGEADSWLDIGSGAGLPGLVIAILRREPVTLVEPRRKRAEFLREAAAHLELAHVEVCQTSIESLTNRRFDAVTARAYAELGRIFSSTVQLTNSSTIWVLPKGRTAMTELAEAQKAWQGMFHVEQSLSDADARIIVATEVRPR